MPRALFLFLLFLSACAPNAATVKPLPLNREMKLDFAAIDALSNKPVTLHGSLNRVTMVHFWATWCPQCLEELRQLQMLHEHFSPQGLEIVAVALASPMPRIQEVISKVGVTFKVWSDPEGRSQELFGGASLPFSAFLNQNGQLIRFDHPQNGTPVTSVSGAYLWGSPQVSERIEKIFSSPDL
jgi:thiol-disulfide isomerase/thioredoxin